MKNFQMGKHNQKLRIFSAVIAEFVLLLQFSPHIITPTESGIISYLSPAITLDRHSLQQIYEKQHTNKDSSGKRFSRSVPPGSVTEQIINNFRKNDKSPHREDTGTLKNVIGKTKTLYEGKKFASGELYFDHAIKVADIVAGRNCSLEVICAALLHKAPQIMSEPAGGKMDREDKARRKKIFNEIGKILGKKQAQKIRGLIEKFLKITEFSYAAMNLENPLDRLLFMDVLIQQTEGDPAVMQLVLADKEASIKTASEFDRDELIAEIGDIYAWLAYRLGQTEIKENLLDESFKQHYLKSYKKIEELAAERLIIDVSDGESVFGKLEKKMVELEQKLRNDWESFLRGKYPEDFINKITISVRAKKPYDIIEKILHQWNEHQKNVQGVDVKEMNDENFLNLFKTPDFLEFWKEKDPLNDIIGIRFVCDLEPTELFHVLPFVQKYIGKKGWHKDQFDSKSRKIKTLSGDLVEDRQVREAIYLDLKKDDTELGLPLEIQILTKVFHETRESGEQYAPHWLYKFGKRERGLLKYIEPYEPIGDFAADFARVYRHVSERIVVFARFKSGFKPVMLPKEAHPIDLAASVSVNKFSDYKYAIISSWRNNTLTKERTIALEDYSLKPGDMVTLIEENGYILIHPLDELRFIVSRKGNLRTKLLFSILTMDKPQPNLSLEYDKVLEKRGISVPQKKQADSERLWDSFLHNFAQKKWLKNKEELFLALNYCREQIQEIDIINEAIKTGIMILQYKLRMDDFALGRLSRSFSQYKGIDVKDNLFFLVGSGLITEPEIENAIRKLSLQREAGFFPQENSALLIERSI